MLTGQQVEIFEGRTYYRAKGVDWARFLPCCLAALVVAALLAEGMAELFRAGHYYIFIIPLLAALCVAGMMTFAVGQGRCRSVPIAALAGFGAGMVLYIGYFYFGMLRDLGPEFATRPAVLAKYIRLRMDVEVTRDINESDRDEKPNLPKQGDVYLNWARFVFELGLVLVITIGEAVKRARKSIVNPVGAGRCGKSPSLIPHNPMTCSARSGLTQSVRWRHCPPKRPLPPSPIFRWRWTCARRSKQDSHTIVLRSFR